MWLSSARLMHPFNHFFDGFIEVMVPIHGLGTKNVQCFHLGFLFALPFASVMSNSSSHKPLPVLCECDSLIWRVMILKIHKIVDQRGCKKESSYIDWETFCLCY